MKKVKQSLTVISLILAFSFSGCGVNPFDLSLLTNNVFASVMVAFLRNVGVPVGSDKRPEGNDTEKLAKASARSLNKLAANDWPHEVISVQEAEDSLKAWLSEEFVEANKSKLLQAGDSILYAEMVNDTDNFEVKNGHVIINIGNKNSKLNTENFRFWAFMGHNKKIQIDSKGDKVGEEADVSGLVMIPSNDRRIFWKGVVTKAMDGMGEDNDEYNVGDSATAFVDSIIYSAEDDDYVQYGSMDYYDKSREKNTLGIEIKIFHNNTTSLDESNWSDNLGVTHFPLKDETGLGENDKQYYIVAKHFGENYPKTDEPYEYREEGTVYRERKCKDRSLTEEECTLKIGYDYTGKYIYYQKPRGNEDGTATFYDEDGNEIDSQKVTDNENSEENSAG
ncbi:MAG: hypothetical protein HQK83_16450 [Fibrobacteria bacterium]|nr:hypothetical protein [Fibrobacteria bacterium]